MSTNSVVRALASGAQLGSFFDATSKDSYSNYLGTEVAILTRKVYLPLLPQEKMTYGILKAYDYLIETGEMPDSEFHPKSYWTKDEVYADFYEGNFYIPMLFPQLDSPGEKPDEMESTLTKYNAVEPDIVGGELSTDGFYVKSNFVNLKIPKYIATMFRSTIPKNTKFSVNFVGGNSQMSNIFITGLLSIGEEEEEDPWNIPPKEYCAKFGEFEDYEWEENIKELGDIIINNIEAIEEEEERRKEECEKFKEEEEALFE